MRFYRWIGAILLMAALLALAQASAVQETDAQRFKKTYDVGGAQLVFDAQVDRPVHTDAQPVLVRYAEWTPERLNGVFLEGRGVEMDVVREHIEYVGADGTYMAADPQGFVQYKSAAISGDHAVRLYADACDGLDERGAVDGYPFEEALAQIRALCDRMGATFVVKSYSAIDSQALSESYRGIMRPGSGQTLPTEPPQPPEGYTVYLEFLYEGLSLMQIPNTLNTLNDYALGSAAIVYVTRDEGVISFLCAPLCVMYDVLETSPDAAKPSISMEQAVEAVVKQFSRVIARGTVGFERIAYEYVPVPVRKQPGQFRLMPAWCFYRAGGADEPTFVNALSGKVIE
ncbi:hypothetical protein ACH6CV_15100 [Bacillota bacterium Meth-B3]